MTDNKVPAPACPPIRPGSVRARALAGVRAPYAAILEVLEHGPATTHEIARRLGIQLGSLWPAIREMHRRGELLVRGELIARAAYYERLSDGLHLAVVHCGGGQAEAARGADHGDAA